MRCPGSTQLLAGDVEPLPGPNLPLRRAGVMQQSASGGGKEGGYPGAAAGAHRSLVHGQEPSAGGEITTILEQVKMRRITGKSGGDSLIEMSPSDSGE